MLINSILQSYATVNSSKLPRASSTLSYDANILHMVLTANILSSWSYRQYYYCHSWMPYDIIMRNSLWAFPITNIVLKLDTLYSIVFLLKTVGEVSLTPIFFHGIGLQDFNLFKISKTVLLPPSINSHPLKLSADWKRTKLSTSQPHIRSKFYEVSSSPM